MRTAISLLLIVGGIIALRSAFAENPDPRVVVGTLFASGNGVRNVTPERDRL